MAVYYVLGAMLVVWGLGLAVFGLVRPDFPPSGTAGRTLVGVTVLIVVATLTALLLSTSKEHPREEAAAKAAESGATGATGATGKESTPTTPAPAPASQPSAPSGKPAQTVDVTEKEFSIAFPAGTSLKAGSYKFAAQNQGKIQHDLAVEGGGLNETKTKLIDAGKSADLAVKLNPGKYTFYCSVPGHEQAGMKVAVTVK
jgi:plastocyanin